MGPLYPHGPPAPSPLRWRGGAGAWREGDRYKAGIVRRRAGANGYFWVPAWRCEVLCLSRVPPDSKRMCCRLGSNGRNACFGDGSVGHEGLLGLIGVVASGGSTREMAGDGPHRWPVAG